MYPYTPENVGRGLKRWVNTIKLEFKQNKS